MKLLQSLLIIRPLNVILSGCAVYIAAHIINESFSTNTIDFLSFSSIIFQILVVCSYTAASNVINDIYDIKSDAINHPNRPLPKKAISKKQAIIISIILFMLGIVCSLQLAPINVSLLPRRGFIFANFIIF